MKLMEDKEQDKIKEVVQEGHDRLSNFFDMKKPVAFFDKKAGLPIADDEMKASLQQALDEMNKNKANNKDYFAPKESDIRVGYQCEIYQGIWSAINVIPTTIYAVIKMIGMGKVRTPRLTVQQIKAEGLNEEARMLIADYGENGKDENLYLLYKGSLAMIFNQEKHELTIWQRTEDKAKEYNLFKGYCPSINEFRQICELLNIK